MVLTLTSGRGLEQAVSAVASLEQIPGGGPGQEREGDTGERGRDQGLEEVAGNHFQPVQGQVGVWVWSLLNNNISELYFSSSIIYDHILPLVQILLPNLWFG